MIRRHSRSIPEGSGILCDIDLNDLKGLCSRATIDGVRKRCGTENPAPSQPNWAVRAEGVVREG